MKKFFTIIIICLLCCSANAQERIAQNKPYIDLRPLHFGILVGLNMQDIEFENVGPQTVIAEDGTESIQSIVCDADRWSPGFSVGVLAEMRLNDHFSARLTPTMQSTYATFGLLEVHFT